MTNLHHELERIGTTLNRWKAEQWAATSAAVLCAALGVAGLADFLFRFGFAGRFILWAVLVVLAGAAVWRIGREVRRRWTAEGVAAAIERAFPRLDNRLINTVQFSGLPKPDALEAACVAQGVPGWSEVDVRQMKDRRGRRRAGLGLAAGVLFLAAPGFWSGPSWGNALLRVLNPFSARPPATLAVILRVDPGDRVVVQGAPLVLSCSAQGKRHQPAFVDLMPADDRKVSVRLGALAGSGSESFAHRLPQVKTEIRYRFRVGDAVSPPYRIRVRPPLALAAVELVVQPPAYTRLPPRAFDGLAGEALIPQGASVRATVRGTCPMKALTADAGAGAAPFAPTDDPAVWTGLVHTADAREVRLRATDEDGFATESTLKIQVIPDRPPAIQVAAPAGRTAIGAGASPQIQWTVSDDYGLSAVVLERVTPSPSGVVAAVPVQEWPVAAQRDFSALWTGSVIRAGTKDAQVFRIAAIDNAPGRAAHRSESPLIVFEPVTAGDAADADRRSDADTDASLDRLLAMQTENLDRTRKLDGTLDTAKAEQWAEASGVQKDVRRIAGRLLGDPRKPLGALARVMDRLFRDEMVEVIDALRQVPAAPAAEKGAFARRSVFLQQRILDTLTRVEQGADRAQRHGQITGLLALLDALVRGQDQALGTTRATVKSSAALPAGLVDKQDALAGDVGEFVGVCRKEARGLERADKEFAALVVQVADACEQRAVAADMTRAAERLESQAGAEAVPFQERALAALKECQDLMTQWRAAEATEKMDELREAVADGKERLQRMQNLQKKVLDSIRAVEQQKDMSKKEMDELQEEIAELKANLGDAALQLAKDLNVLPELPVGNELVEDVYQVYEECEQIPGSDKTKATETGVQKEDFILDLLEKTTKRADDMEMWLTDKPDATKRNVENFDKTEMPQIPVIPLPTKMEDIIGELLKQEEEERDKADDSAQNQGVPDMAMGWDVVEGEWTTYSGKGKSGNERPDHKEQDGRSGIGRQGQSDGESVAGSGKVNEGDEKIEARRTQDSAQSGQVQEEGHQDAKATGGGKNSGYASDFGMPGSGPRRDANTPPSELGMQAMLRRHAEALYAKASLMHVRTGDLDEAIVSMRKAEDAMAAGRIQQVREFQKRAVIALKKTKVELESGSTAATIGLAEGPAPAEEQATGVVDEAPANYRDLVSEYFKSLGQGE